jgi:hypothetical protein
MVNKNMTAINFGSGLSKKNFTSKKDETMPQVSTKVMKMLKDGDY